MNERSTKSVPPLADLVGAGVHQTEAIAINDFIYMSQDISNSYLVTCGGTDILVNAGTVSGAPRHKALFAAHRSGALTHIVLTQSHRDHFGGVELLREPGTLIVAERRFPDTCAYYSALAPYFAPRTAKLWGAILAKQGNPMQAKDVVPEILVDERLEVTLGNRHFEIISTPGGETIDSLTVWLPDDKVVFTGNLFGPMFLAMPFLNTIRGDKPRSVLRYLQSLQTVRDLGADLLITGHGEPIEGATNIRTALERMHAAVSYVNQATIDGMNAGKDVYALMNEIRLPADISIAEWHGKVSWAVRTIWEEYAGWFHYDATTSLYDVPQRTIHGELVEMAGGPTAFAQRARAKLDAGRPLEALHFIEIGINVVPLSIDLQTARLDVLTRLLENSGAINLSETMWLKSELAAAAAAISLASAAEGTVQ
jgi:glyoxylase-like metal-dependent hydrolase (beta-lactamase superfamily II)